MIKFEQQFKYQNLPIADIWIQKINFLNFSFSLKFNLTKAIVTKFGISQGNLMDQKFKNDTIFQTIYQVIKDKVENASLKALSSVKSENYRKELFTF